LRPAGCLNGQRLVELRHQLLEACRAEECRQPTLFELQDGTRPATERTAAGRYQEPTFLGPIAGGHS